MGGGATINSAYDISCNSLRGSKGFGLLVAKTLGAGTAQGTIYNNRFGQGGAAGSASTEAAGLDVDTRGAGTHTVRIKNNIVTDWGANGAIQLFNNQGSSTMNLTVIGNLSDNPNPANGLAGLYAETGALGGDTNITNLLVGGSGRGREQLRRRRPVQRQRRAAEPYRRRGHVVQPLARHLGGKQRPADHHRQQRRSRDGGRRRGDHLRRTPVPAVPPGINESCSPSVSLSSRRRISHRRRFNSTSFNPTAQAPSFALSALRTAAMRMGASHSRVQPRRDYPGVRLQPVIAAVVRLWTTTGRTARQPATTRRRLDGRPFSTRALSPRRSTSMSPPRCPRARRSGWSST